MAITSYLGPSIRCHFLFSIYCIMLTSETLCFIPVISVYNFTCDENHIVEVSDEFRSGTCVCATARPTQDIKLDADEENKSQTKTAFSRSNLSLCVWATRDTMLTAILFVRLFGRVCIHWMDSLSRIRTHEPSPGIQRIERFKRARCLRNANTQFAFGSCKRSIHLHESHMINAPFHVARCLLLEFSVCFFFFDLRQKCTRPNDNEEDDDDDNFDVLPLCTLSWLLVQAMSTYFPQNKNDDDYNGKTGGKYETKSNSR